MADIVENLNDLAKEVFAEGGVPDLIPNGCKLQKAVEFKKTEMTGEKYSQAVRLAYPNGFTHALGDGTEGAFSLRGAKKGIQKKAEVQPTQIVLQDQMSYEDAGKIKKGKQAFIDGVGYVIEGMQMASRKRLETCLWYGGAGLGTISGAPATDGSNKVLTIAEAEWASLIWVGNEGMALDAYNGGSKINANADLVLEEVNVEERKLTVSGNATDLGNLADTHTLYFAGAKGKEMTGVHGILSNTGSLFGIDAGTYGLWKAAQKALSSQPLSFQAVKRVIGLGVSKGLEEDVDLYLNNQVWDDVVEDVAALRRTDKQDVKKIDIGHEEVVFHSQNGKVRLIPSGYVKIGYAYGLTPRHWKRIGAKDITLNTPGFDDKMFFHLESKAGVEMRTYTNQAIFGFRPAANLYLSGITLSGDA